MNDREFSDIQIFQHSEREYRCLWPVIKITCKPITTTGGVSSILKIERNNFCVANGSDQFARMYKENFFHWNWKLRQSVSGSQI